MRDKHELFCQKYCEIGNKTHKNATQAYLAAYPSSNLNTCATNGCKLLRNANIMERISQIDEQQYKEAAGSKAKVLNSLWSNYDTALSVTQDEHGNETPINLSAGNKALELIGKELGMFTERKNLTVDGHVKVEKVKTDISERLESLLDDIDQQA